MTYNLISCSQSVILCIRRILRQNECFYPFKRINLSRENSSSFLSRYHEDKYSELRNRLARIPCLHLLNKEVDKVRFEFCYEKNKGLEDFSKWCSKVFDYNVKNGKKIRSVALLKAFCIYGFTKDDTTWDQWDSASWRSAILLAWCIEMLQAHFFLQDDIMDQSALRRGEPCWYKFPDIGLHAINDSMLLQFGINKLLKKYFAGSRCYTNVFHEFLQANQETQYGQCIDILLTSSSKRPKFNKFTFEAYQTLVEYKSAHYTFRLPVHLAMHLAGGYSVKDFDLTREICMKLGLYYQCQDDYLDCFGNSDITGKFGNDIREGKCTWFAVKFLEEVSNSMKKQFMENYGSDNKDATSKVLELYKQANLREKFEEFDEQLCAEICVLAESMNDIKGAFFYDLLAQIQGREK